MKYILDTCNLQVSRGKIAEDDEVYYDPREFVKASACNPMTTFNAKKSFWLGTLAYLLPTFPLGYFWHLAWFHGAYETLGLYRTNVIIPMGLLSMIIQALFFAWSYPKLFNTTREAWLLSALKSFVIFAFFAWSFTTLPIAAKYRLTSVTHFMLLETAFTFLQFAIVSPLLALAWRERKS